MKRILAVLLTLVLFASFLTACGAGGASAPAPASTAGAPAETAAAGDAAGTPAAGVNDTLTIGLHGEIASLDAIYAYDFTTNPVVIQITESLLYYDGPNNELKPGLLESWQKVDDKTYTYKVRSNVNFSDGSPMTMDDVLFSLSRYKDEEAASYLSWMYDNVASIEKTGDWEFTVKLTQPDALWKDVFATTGGHILSKAYFEAHKDNYGKPEGGVLGTGPYKFDSWDVGSQITLSYNDKYWDKTAPAPDVKKVIFQIISEDTTRVMAVTSGQTDIILSTAVEMLDNVKKADNVKLSMIPSYGLEFISFNCKKAPFDDVNVRKAIAYALDNKVLEDNIVKDFGTLPKSIPVPESLFLFEKDTWTKYADGVDHYDYNIEKAKEMLAASSVPNGFDCTLHVDEFSIKNSIALYVQQALAQIGINVKIEKVSNDEIVSLQFGSGIDANGVRPYDMGIFEWSSDFPDPSGVLTPLYASWNSGDGGSNSCAYSNKEVDQLLLDQAATTDTVKRTELMTKALDIINAEVPNYIYTHQNWLFTANNRVTAGIDNMTGTWFWNFYVKNIKVK